MLKKIAAVGAVGAVILGAGTAALATSHTAGDSSAAASSASPQTAVPGKASGAAKHLAKHGLGRSLHAQWVTRDGQNGAFVTHDAIRGQVTAVSSTSITVKAADNVIETYAVNAATKVRIKGKDKPGAIGTVKVNDRVLTVGTGTTTPTATRILDMGTAK
jgi:hypothetical protein